MSAQETQRHVLKKEIQLLLGDQMVEVELDDEHMELAIKIAIGPVGFDYQIKRLQLVFRH